MLIVCMDANFRLRNQMVSNDRVDPGLGTGLSYFVPPEKYKAHLLACMDIEDISTCMGFAALASHRGARGEFIMPNGVGDLQKGER